LSVEAATPCKIVENETGLGYAQHLALQLLVKSALFDTELLHHSNPAFGTCILNTLDPKLQRDDGR
jgi:hypothetical protein